MKRVAKVDETWLLPMPFWQSASFPLQISRLIMLISMINSEGEIERFAAIMRRLTEEQKRTIRLKNNKRI